jgi:nitrate reductase gamma subunit
MNRFPLIIKKRGTIALIIGITSFICAFYFNAKGKNDTSLTDLFLYIFLPILIAPSIYMIIISRKEKNK